MDDSKLFNLVRAYPIPSNVTITKIVVEDIPLTHLSLDQVAMPSWDQFAAETFHPIRAMPFMTKLFISTAVILILILTFRCLYRKGYCSCFNKRSQNMTPSYQTADD